MALRLTGVLLRLQAVVLVATKGACRGKPRPWVVVQEDAYDGTDSIILCLFTHQLVEDAGQLRIDISPSDENGLRNKCQLQVETIVTVPQHDVDRVIGWLEDGYMRRLDDAVRHVMGL